MTHDNTISDPVAELLASQNAEIAKYRWLESRLKGHDIGWQRASDEWFEKEFRDWAREQRRLIDEALSMAEFTPGTTGGRAVPKLQPR